VIGDKALNNISAKTRIYLRIMAVSHAMRRLPFASRSDVDLELDQAVNAFNGPEEWEMRLSSDEATKWLYRLDSYTNAVFGRPRTLSVINDSCVACSGPLTAASANGLCPKCLAQRQPDTTEIVLFRPLRGNKPT
jgi:hypothetical protein